MLAAKRSPAASLRTHSTAARPPQSSRRRRNSLRVAAFEQLGREVEERAILVAHARAAIGSVERGLDDGILPGVQVPRAGDAHVDAVCQH